MSEAARTALAEMRLLIYELRPPEIEELGLQWALETRLATVERRAGLQTKLDYAATDDLLLRTEVELERIATEALTKAAIDSLLADLSSDGAFATPTGRAWNDAGTVALIEVPLAIDGNTPEAYAAIERLRSELIPAAFSATEAEVLVGGDVAETTDLDALVDLWTPRVLALVLGLSFVVLLLAFRSLVVPVKAILLNLLSVAAVYGVMVYVFQQGMA